MSDEVNSRRPASATTPQSKPQPHGGEPASDGAAATSESESLRQQATDARDAAVETLHEMRETLKQAGDPRAWAREYPWSAMALAAAAGFLAITALVPRRQRRQTEALTDRILSDPQIAARIAELSGSDAPQPRGTVLGRRGIVAGQNV